MNAPHSEIKIKEEEKGDISDLGEVVSNERLFDNYQLRCATRREIRNN